ncbi:MAG: hypothetical protein ACP5D0_04250 [Hydrogenovibrio sp.]
MSHKHKAIIQKAFAHPIATNIDWKKMAAALESFGAEIEVSNANRAHVKLRDAEITLGLPHHGHELANRDEITQLRRFLEEVGLTPDKV